MNHIVSSETVTSTGGSRVAVARAHTLMSMLVLTALIFIGVSFRTETTPAQLISVAVAAIIGLAAIRASRIGLFVSADSVDVVNFFSERSFDRRTVRIDFEAESSQWPGDDIPAAIRSGVRPAGEGSPTAHVNQTAPAIRALYVGDGAGERIRVNVVPSYGDRSNRIVRDLRKALDG